MKKPNKEFFRITLVISILIITLFWQFFIKGLHPYPGNYMLAWYSPWKYNFSVDSVITIPHKAVADDIFRQLLPFRLLAYDMQKNIQWPLWNPYNGAGMPLFAVITLSLSAVVIARLLYAEYIYILSYMPLLLYIIESYFSHDNKKSVFIIPFLILLIFLSGQPQM